MSTARGLSPQPPSPVGIPFGDEALWSTPLDTAELALHVAWCRAPASTTKEKGKRLEQLLSWLFPHLPGFRAERTNLYSSDGSQEIDILFWNDQKEGGFPNFGSCVLAECKNWEQPVDSSDVAWFDWKLRLGGVSEGVLLAANGITANGKRHNAAVSILNTANADTPGRSIYVITLDEVAALTSTVHLRTLLIQKSLGLAARSPLE